LLKLFLNKVDYSLSGKITEYYFEFAVSKIGESLKTKTNEQKT